MSAIRSESRFVLAALLCAAALPAQAQLEPTKTVEVRCGRGETIAQALTLGDERKPLEIVVYGTCAESVEISRSDVTLRAGVGGGAIAGPDAALDDVFVTGSRVTIDGIAVTGGRNGIRASGAAGLTVRSATISDTGRSGIYLAWGSSAVVDGCTIARNPRDGVIFEGSSGFVLRSTITYAGRNGISVVNGSGVRVGIDGANAAAGNIVSYSGANGIAVGLSSSMYLGASEISWNGTDATSLFGRTGVNVVGATVSIVGGNTIVDNAGSGVAGYRSASITIGDPAIGLDVKNTVSRNAKADLSGGVFGFQGTSILVRSATVADNGGFGVGLSLRSAGQIVGSTITGNGDGIRLLMGGGLYLGSPTTTVSGNSGWGVQCFDAESSLTNTFWLSMSGNTSGNVAAACTPF